MKILFLHGWHSVPGGVKPTYLVSHGHMVLNPALDDDDFDAAVTAAQELVNSEQPDVIVGSSRGGAVAMNVESAAIPLVLLCPAWKRWGRSRKLKPNAAILHSRNDEVIPFSESEELIKVSHLPPEVLIEVGTDHRLADEEPLSVMLWACNLLGTGKLIPSLNVDADGTGAPTESQQTDSQKECTYICDACGEEIVIPVDLSEGADQSYVEDCPVCCRANKIHVEIDSEGEPHLHAEPEQDYDD